MYEKAKDDVAISSDLILTLLAIAAMTCFYYGVRAIIICIVCSLSCYMTDLVALRLQQRRGGFRDYSSIITGLIAALMMPASIDYVTASICCCTATVIAKQSFGGRGNEIFNPAAVAYMLAAICRPAQMLKYPSPNDVLSVTPEISTTLSNSFSSFFNKEGSTEALGLDTLLGNFCGPMGTTQFLVLLVCVAILFFRRSVSPAAFAGAIGIFAFVSYISPIYPEMNTLSYVAYELIANMFVFGTAFLVADLHYLPQGTLNRFLYGILVGGFTLVFRRISHVENPIVFASVISAPFTSLIDDYYRRFMLMLRDMYIKIRKTLSTRAVWLPHLIFTAFCGIGLKLSNFWHSCFSNGISIIKHSDDADSSDTDEIESDESDNSADDVEEDSDEKE